MSLTPAERIIRARNAGILGGIANIRKHGTFGMRDRGKVGGAKIVKLRGVEWMRELQKRSTIIRMRNKRLKAKLAIDEQAKT